MKLNFFWRISRRFRVAVVCVLAARRLRLFTEESNVPMFTCNESAISSSRIIVVAGKGEKKTPRMKSKSTIRVFPSFTTKQYFTNLAYMNCFHTQHSKCVKLFCSLYTYVYAVSDSSFAGDVPIQSRSDAAVDWLSNNHVIHSVRDATCGVVDAVAKNKGDTSGKSYIMSFISTWEFVTIFWSHHIIHSP